MRFFPFVNSSASPVQVHMTNLKQELKMTRAAFLAFSLILVSCGSSHSTRSITLGDAGSQEIAGSSGENSGDGSGGNETGSGSGATPGHSGADNSGGSSGALDTGGSGGTPETGGSAAVENQAGRAGSPVVNTGGSGTGGELVTGGTGIGGDETGGMAGFGTGGTGTGGTGTGGDATGGDPGTGGDLGTGGDPGMGGIVGTGGGCVPLECPALDKDPCFYTTIDDGCGNPIQCPTACSDMNYCNFGVCTACTSQQTDEEVCATMTDTQCGYVHRPYVSDECNAPVDCVTNFDYATCYPWYAQCEQNCSGIESCDVAVGQTIGQCTGCRLANPVAGASPCQNSFHPESGNQLFYRYDCDDPESIDLPLDQCLQINGPYWCCETDDLG